jgi:hypothetical protein
LLWVCVCHLSCVLWIFERTQPTNQISDKATLLSHSSLIVIAVVVVVVVDEKEQVPVFTYIFIYLPCVWVSVILELRTYNCTLLSCVCVFRCLQCHLDGRVFYSSDRGRRETPVSVPDDATYSVRRLYCTTVFVRHSTSLGNISSSRAVSYAQFPILCLLCALRSNQLINIRLLYF